MQRKTYKIGQNRGNARIWLEGAVLLKNNRTRGSRFVRIINDDVLTLSFDEDDFQHDKMHTVAGSDSRPIIDMNGKYLSEFFGDATHYEVTFSETFYIHIRGTHND